MSSFVCHCSADRLVVVQPRLAGLMMGVTAELIMTLEVAVVCAHANAQRRCELIAAPLQLDVIGEVIDTVLDNVARDPGIEVAVPATILAGIEATTSDGFLQAVELCFEDLLGREPRVAVYMPENLVSVDSKAAVFATPQNPTAVWRERVIEVGEDGDLELEMLRRFASITVVSG